MSRRAQKGVDYREAEGKLAHCYCGRTLTLINRRLGGLRIFWEFGDIYTSTGPGAPCRELGPVSPALLGLE